nr:uncharacterized protein LOC109174483 [Ipomoea trifida]
MSDMSDMSGFGAQQQQVDSSAFGETEQQYDSTQEQQQQQEELGSSSSQLKSKMGTKVKQSNRKKPYYTRSKTVFKSKFFGNKDDLDGRWKTDDLNCIFCKTVYSCLHNAVEENAETMWRSKSSNDSRSLGGEEAAAYKWCLKAAQLQEGKIKKRGD